MKNGIYQIILIAIVSFALISCNKDDDNNRNQTLNGNYNGTFTVEYLNGDTFSNPVQVRFNIENSYESSRNDNDIPAGGSGTYKLNNSTIDFTDVNQWTADFDWNLILNGEYNYSINGKELILSANKNDVGFYKYQLIKEE